MNIIFTGKFGSDLYGLTTKNSDIDINSVYLPNKKELVFNTYKDVINDKNNGLDINNFSIQKFFKMLSKADTVSIDMLHTPENSTLKNSVLWKEIRKNRSCVYSKNMRGIIGYIKTQSGKYGHKPERLKEMRHFLNFLKSERSFDSTAIKYWINYNWYKHIFYVPEKPEAGNVIAATVDVCGSRYHVQTPLHLVTQSIEKKIDRYGKRSVSGVTENGDWKSLSHSYRVLLQLEEIIDTRDLIFPLKQKSFILQIKTGCFTSERVASLISDKYDLVMEKLEKSDLPEYSNLTPIENTILNNYF